MPNDKHLELKEYARISLKDAEKTLGNFRAFYATCKANVQTKKARNHSIVRCLISIGNKYQWKKGTIKVLHDIYKAIGYGRNYKPKASGYKYFFDCINTLKVVPDYKLDCEIVEILRNKPKGFGRGKAPEEAKRIVDKYYLEKLSFPLIAEKILYEHDGFGYWKGKPPTSWVKKYVTNNPELKNIGILYREGASAHRKKVVTPLNRKKPEFSLSQVQIDGSTLPFAEIWTDQEGKQTPIYGNYFICLDVASSMIIGASTCISENSWMILKALEDSVRKTGYLPAELVCDNASAFSKQEVKKFLAAASKFERYGFVGKMESFKTMIFKKDRTRNPQTKASVESANNRLQRLMYSDPFSHGQGIKTSNRKPDELTHELRKSKYLLSREEAHYRFMKWVDAYNDRAMGDGLSPRQKFERLENRYGIKIEDYEIPILFWPHRDVKISRGLVTIELKRGERFHFELNGPKEKEQLNGKTVTCFYDTDDLSQVIVTDKDHQNPIVLHRQPMPQIATVEQTDDDRTILGVRRIKNSEEKESRIMKVASILNSSQTKSENKMAINFHLNQIDNDPLRKQKVETPTEERMIAVLHQQPDNDEWVAPVIRVIDRWADD